MRNILSLTQVLDTTYDIYRKHMISVIGYTALTSLISVCILYGVMIVVGIIFVIIFSVIAATMAFSGGDNFAILGAVGIGFLLLMLPAFSIMQLVAAGPIHGVEESRKGNNITFGMMFGYSFKKLLYVMTSTLAYYLVICTILGVSAAVYYFAYITILNQTIIQVQVGVAIFVGLLIVLFCIWFAIKSALYLPVALCEKRHFFGGIVGSFRLVKGQFKRMFCILFSSILSYYLIYISLGGLSSVASNIFSAVLTNSGNSGLMIGFLLLQFLLSLVQLAVGVCVAPIQYLTIPIIYFNERNRKYGDDLFERLNVLVVKQQAVIQ